MLRAFWSSFFVNLCYYSTTYCTLRPDHSVWQSPREVQLKEHSLGAAITKWSCGRCQHIYQGLPSILRSPFLAPWPEAAATFSLNTQQENDNRMQKSLVAALIIAVICWWVHFIFFLFSPYNYILPRIERSQTLISVRFIFHNFFSVPSCYFKLNWFINT